MKPKDVLQPCPFCGGDAQVNTWTMHGITESRCFCPNSDCPNSVRTVALEQWNTRPIEDALNKRIAELEAESERFTVHSRIKRQDDKWIPVSERLPEKQKLTIGFTDNSAYVFFEIVNDDEMGLVMYPYQNRKGTVTHWMPLPSTPEVQE